MLSSAIELNGAVEYWQNAFYVNGKPYSLEKCVRKPESSAGVYSVELGIPKEEAIRRGFKIHK